MMWKLIVFVASGTVHGADGLIFLEEQECRDTASQIESLDDGWQGTRIATICVQGLFWDSLGD